MYSIGNGALVARRSVELTTKLSLFLSVEILRCSAFTVPVRVEMGNFSFLVMATPRKEDKRCHLTTGQTPNEKKRNQPGGHKQGHIVSRKSLAYDSVEQNNKVSFLYILFSTCSYFFVLIYFYLFTYCTSHLHHVSGECCKELL